jgi:hypothetical protein
VRALGWLIVLASFAGIAYALARWRKRWEEHERAAEARMAQFIALAKGPGPAAPLGSAADATPAAPAPQERLLLDAAGKASEAGEPVLAIQLYARLLSRFPQTAFAAQARAAVLEQKKKLPKA